MYRCISGLCRYRHPYLYTHISIYVCICVFIAPVDWGPAQVDGGLPREHPAMPFESQFCFDLENVYHPLNFQPPSAHGATEDSMQTSAAIAANDSCIETGWSYGGYSLWGLPTYGRAWFRRLSTARMYLHRRPLASMRQQKKNMYV
jgi:hypothetical protein